MEYDLSYDDSPSLKQTLADLLRGMSKKQAYQELGQGIQNTAKVIPSVVESLGRGAIAQVPGTFGDISQLARQFAPETMQSVMGNRVAPTTEEILAKIPRLNPDYQGSSQHETIGGLISPAMPSLLRAGSKVTKGLKGGLTIEDVDAMKIAQHNASLPIKEGGLGLPKDNTAMDRAKAMGYEIPVYHGTNADINVFNVQGKDKTSGAGAFLTTNPNAAETYVSSSGGGNILPLLLKKDDFLTANARGRNWADIYTNELSAKSGKNRYTPQELGLDINSATTTDKLGIIANELSKKGAEIKNVKDLGPNSHVMRAKEYLLQKYGIVPNETWSNVTGKQFDEAQKAMKKFYESQKSDVYAIQDPSLIRSRFAAFDPKRASEANILAGGLAIPTSGITLKQQLEEQFNKIKK